MNLNPKDSIPNYIPDQSNKTQILMVGVMYSIVSSHYWCIYILKKSIQKIKLVSNIH
jgi:hypothetical protein